MDSDGWPIFGHSDSVTDVGEVGVSEVSRFPLVASHNGPNQLPSIYEYPCRLPYRVRG